MERIRAVSGAVMKGAPVSPKGWFGRLPRAARLLSIPLGLATLFTLLYAEENWRGERAWASCQRELAGRGVDLSHCLQAERAAFGNQLFEYAITHKNALRSWVASETSAPSLVYLLGGPEGWLRQEQVAYHRLFDARLLAGFDLQTGRLRPHRIEEAHKALEVDVGRSAFWHHTALSNLLLSHLMDVFKKAAVGQTRLELAATACAFERFRLARGDFPQTLDALVPQFADALPLDPCGEGPLRYRREAAGRFLLYGVGWNQTDDSGTSVTNSEGSGPSLGEGDWVWPPYPGK